MKIETIIQYLKDYDGPEIKLMEVCGTHTSSIFKSGIRSLISPKIKLISGPGCPVCVTPTAYIDKCVIYAMKENHVVVTFGDMMKVTGSNGSLADNKGMGAKVEIMYSPMEVVETAAKNTDKTYVIAAVGFETTVPTYALAMEEAERRGVTNLKFVTALKQVMPALEWICQNEEGIDGFICPGHVSVIIGSAIYEEISRRYNKPFTVAGFEPEHILATIYDLVRSVEKKENMGGEDFPVHNLYSNAVKTTGNEKAKMLIEKYFESGPAMWRGLGIIEDSGLYIGSEYSSFDGGSYGLDQDMELPETCKCSEVIIGRINPNECPMFGQNCNPTNPYGPCMVSTEGACGIWYRNGGNV